MKKILLLSIFMFSLTLIWAQEESRNYRIPLIGEVAPSFTAESTTGVLNFPEDFGRKWKILLSHPQDFTAVCSSEILELAHLQEEFDKIDTRLAVLSTDPLDLHFQWKKALEEVEFKGKSPVKIEFPLIDDENLSVSKKYGMINYGSNSTRDVRGVYILDPDNTIQAIYFYPENVGRSTTELLRAVTALQTAVKYSVRTPADWQRGDDVFLPYMPDKSDSKAAGDAKNVNALTWFMLYRKLDQ